MLCYKHLTRYVYSVIVAGLTVTVGILGATPAMAAGQKPLTNAISEQATVISESVATMSKPASHIEASVGTEIFSDDPIKQVNSIWNKANGVYTWCSSAQYNNGILSIKVLPNGLVLYDFKIMRGSEADESTTPYTFAGIMSGNDTTSDSEFVVGDNTVKLTFSLKDDVILVTQSGDLAVDLSGEYKLINSGKIQASKASIVALLESLSPAATSMNIWNRPFTIEIADNGAADGLITVNAVHIASQKVFASFKVASDLSKVYRMD